MKEGEKSLYMLGSRRLADLSGISDQLTEVETRLGLFSPEGMVSRYVQRQIKGLGYTQDEYARLLRVSPRTVANWLNGSYTPDFPSVVLMLCTELATLGRTEVLDDRTYNPRDGLLGLLLTSGLLTREEVRNALTRLGEVMAVEVFDGSPA